MQPLHLNFKPSYQLTILLIGMGLIMSAILIAMPIVWHIKLSILVLIVASVTYATAKYALLLLPVSVIALDITQQNKINIKLKDGLEMNEVSVCAETVVTPYLTVLRLQQKNAPLLRRVFKISIVVLTDTTDAASFRKLRVWLRWGAKPV
jgi:toxin CptA